MGNFLQKQGVYLLRNKPYAYFLTAALAFVPCASWLSVSVIALVTLRKGSYEGFRLFLLGLALTLIISSWHVLLPFELPIIGLTFGLTYVAALALRMSVSLKMLITGLVLFGLFMMLCIQWLWPIAITEQFEALMVLLQKSLPDEVFKTIFSQNTKNQSLLANYLLGIQMLSIILSTLSSMMMARYIQSLIYYPGGFRNELLTFKATRIGVFLLLISSIGAYYHYPLAISALPTLLVYLMAAGMLVLFKLMVKKKEWLTMLFLLVPLIIAPYVMLPIYVIFGSLDSFLNFPRLFPSKTGKRFSNLD